MASASSSIQNEFSSALHRGTASDVQACIDRGAKLDEQLDFCGLTMFPLHFTVLTGSLQKVEVLIAANAPLESRILGGETPLHSAVQFRDDLPMSSQLLRREIVQILIRAGANLQADENYSVTPLGTASRDVDMAIMLLREGARFHVERTVWLATPALGASQIRAETHRAIYDRMIPVIDTLHDRVTQEVRAFIFAWEANPAMSFPLPIVQHIVALHLAILEEVPKLGSFEEQPSPSSWTIPGGDRDTLVRELRVPWSS